MKINSKDYYHKNIVCSVIARYLDPPDSHENEEKLLLRSRRMSFDLNGESGDSLKDSLKKGLVARISTIMPILVANH